MTPGRNTSDSRPTPVMNRALVAALVMYVAAILGLNTLAPETANAVTDFLTYVVLPLIPPIITIVQAKLAERKVTPVADPLLNPGQEVTVKTPAGKPNAHAVLDEPTPYPKGYPPINNVEGARGPGYADGTAREPEHLSADEKTVEMNVHRRQPESGRLCPHCERGI